MKKAIVVTSLLSFLIIIVIDYIKEVKKVQMPMYKSYLGLAVLSHIEKGRNIYRKGNIL